MKKNEKDDSDDFYINDILGGLFRPPICEKIKTTLIYINISCLFILIILCIHFLNLQITFTVTVLYIVLIVLITYQLYISIIMPTPITCNTKST
ncbi:MAG: LbFV-ORF23-like protein [Cotesia congregata filamentous virus 2]